MGEKNTGKIPVYLRISLDRKKAEMRFNVEILPAGLKKIGHDYHALSGQEDDCECST
jgi:hypothetical protein